MEPPLVASTPQSQPSNLCFFKPAISWTQTIYKEAWAP